MSKCNFFNNLKVKNIYLKSVEYVDHNTGNDPQKLNISSNINIESHEENNVLFILKNEVLVNEGKNVKIVTNIAIEIDIEINENFTGDINKNLEEVAKKIIDVNHVEKRVSLLIANITGALGDMPIFLPDDSYTRVDDEEDK